MIYLDNAATSFPKPEETIDSVHHFLTFSGGNPGRGGHPLSIDAARIVFEAREGLSSFINGKRSERLIFTQNGTESLNLAILGLIGEGDHVVTTALEHNSVMRPLDFLTKTRHVQVSVVPCSPAGSLDLKALKKAVSRRTKAVVVNHGSNILGTVQPLDGVREAIGDRLLILDACQTIGNVPIDVQKDAIDVICFSCHKALFGIQGLGAVYLREGVDPIPLKFGGTGSNSEFTEQPTALPDRYESGTPATPAIAGLLGGLKFIDRKGLKEIVGKKRAATERILEGLQRIPGIRVYGEMERGDHSLPIVLMNVDNKEPSEVGHACNRADISVRVGLHCAPMAHRTLGTFPGGGVRISPGYFTRDDEIDRLMEVMRTIAAR
ncbi:MAG TPA: aminotransferase class V-fold PLP-dependent enzyme [Syntrophorhabdales bacterium]|nr:aminotransferase class V-fold PLP-dependent enzyme [Syntrophorhabdales bacterium]